MEERTNLQGYKELYYQSVNSLHYLHIYNLKQHLKVYQEPPSKLDLMEH